MPKKWRHFFFLNFYFEEKKNPLQGKMHENKSERKIFFSVSRTRAYSHKKCACFLMLQFFSSPSVIFYSGKVQLTLVKNMPPHLSIVLQTAQNLQNSALYDVEIETEDEFFPRGGRQKREAKLRAFPRNIIISSAPNSNDQKCADTKNNKANKMQIFLVFGPHGEFTIKIRSINRGQSSLNTNKNAYINSASWFGD